MKQTILFALLSAVIAARADLVMREKIESAKSTSIMTLKIKGDKVREDLTGAQTGDTSWIEDENTGNIVVLIHKTKMIIRRQLVNSPVPGFADAPVDTGKSEKLGGYDTEIYTWKNYDGTTIEEFWVAKTFPDYDKIKIYLPVLEKMNGTGNTKEHQPKVSKLPGMLMKVIRTVKTPESEHTSTTTLISAKEESLDGSIFDIPADYTDMSSKQ